MVQEYKPKCLIMQLYGSTLVTLFNSRAAVAQSGRVLAALKSLLKIAEVKLAINSTMSNNKNK